jgi:hypothetical protein
MGETWSQNVFSSNVSTVAYDAEEKVLYVTFQKGQRYAYKDVPEDVAERLANAPSVGSMLRSDIQPNYSYSRV